MRKRPFEIECMGDKVQIIADEEGVEFLGWDEDAEEAAIALGLEPSPCWIVSRAIVEDRLDEALIDNSYEGNAELVGALIAAGADVHADNEEALRLAAERGHADVVELLLDAKADVHALDDEALILAKHHGYTDVVQILREWIEEHG